MKNITIMGAVLSCFWAGTVCAEPIPLYERLVEQAQPDQEALAHSEKKLKEHKAIKIREKLVIPAFHKQSGELETAPASFCRNCHSPLPHQKQPRTRTFNNMHLRFIACETCHLRPKDLALDYQWFDVEKMQSVNGKNLFRTGQNIDNAQQSPVNPKIAPLYEGKPAFAIRNQAFSKQIAEQWKTASGQSKTLLHAKLHNPLEKKGAECQTCHDEQKSLLNFEALGATVEQSRAIAKHIIPQFMRLYKKDDEHITIRNMLQ